MKQYIDDGVFIAIAILAPLISIWFDYGSEAGYWLQRSGSITVMFAIVLEFRQSKFSETKRSSTVFVGGTGVLIDSSLPSKRQKLQKLAIYLAIVGTLIWGYGDLIQKYMS